MAVSLRVTGTWAELTTDGAVAIPATPQAGDRMYLFARWKDFSVTASVTSPVTWDEIAEFTDGAVTAGNGTGSVKVACWYRDWQSGDTNPTIDFSATVENASVVIMVMAKGADDVWTTPVARSAAMTNWTTTSQIVSASASVAVPSSSVVMGLIGIRDDSATMTRPSTGIDDSTGAITWNGDYVESPATHHSTTTGFDGATDLGYRLVTTGATATLRMTGTISAAETGAALWIIQGVDVLVTPSTASLTLATFVPVLKIGIVPAIAMLALTTFTPTLRANIIPPTTSLTTATFAPQIQTSVIPANVNLTVTSFSPTLSLTVTPTTQSLTLAAFVPSLPTTVTPGTASLTITTTDAPLVGIVTVVTPAALSLSITRFAPHTLPFKPVWLDPGGDAVQAIGHFGAQVSGSGGVISFDTAQKVNGLGSWKFDSGDVVTGESLLIIGESPTIAVPSVMGASRRVSTYFRYGSVPDAISTSTAFAEFSNEIYSGGGFTDPENVAEDVADTYATATPAQNAGQGTRFGSFGFASGSSGLIPINAFIQSVKIIYERKYDTDASIGISRVKYVIDGDEGPDHDNTDQPLTDTVVTVDVTADRPLWTREDLANLTFEVIAEARRGNTSTPHTQSWDYIKVEVVWYIATTILAPSGSAGLGFDLALAPKGAGTVLRFIDGDGASYDGITALDIDAWNRISFGYALHDTSLIDIKIYVNKVEELSIVDAACQGGINGLTNLLFGWVARPGESHLCWFDQIFIDDGSDLSDTGNKLMTAKLPATVNDDDWNTDGGTGAVNERPLSITNYKEHDSPFDPQRQTYTLQAASVGDVDLSGKTLVGNMGWAWAKVGGTFDAENVKLIVNGTEVNRSSFFQNTTPKLITLGVASSAYPSNVRGIGMLSNSESASTTMFDGGVIVAYEGPLEDILLPFQLLAEDSLTPLTDDLRADPPTSYELCYRATDSSGVATITVSSLDQEDGEIQQQAIIPVSGGSGRTRITPGIEVQVSVLVTGGDISMEIWHRLNVD